MKMRASNLLIGSATLLLLAAGLVGLLGFRNIRQQVPLRIVFAGSASGLHPGGSVNFDGLQIGEVKSLTLDSPRRIVVLAMVDGNAPIRKDTIVGVEFQGLTGVAAVALKGGAAAAPPVPLDKDGVPILTADLSEIQSIRDTLHNVDRFLVSNQVQLRDTLRSFEVDTASLAGKAEAIDGFIRQADSAFDGFDRLVGRLPGVPNGQANLWLEKVKSIREQADSLDRSSGAWIEEARRSLLDISEGAVNVTRKFDPNAASGGNPSMPAHGGEKRP